MRLLSMAAAAAAVFSLAAAAQTPAAPPAAAPAPDTVVARVDGAPVTLSEVIAAAQDVLPADMRQMPPEMLLQVMPPEIRRQLIERTVTERALLNAARGIGLDKDPIVSRRMVRASEQELQQAYLSKEVTGTVTEAALRARYEQDTARHQGEEEVRASHILLKTEAEANAVLAELAKGADFATLAKARSADPGARDGGDLGFFKRGDMVPEFAEAAFALPVGQTSKAPVKTGFGWHIIRVEERRAAPVATYEDAKAELRKEMIEQQVEAVVQKVRAGAKIEILDVAVPGQLLQGAAPPPAPARR